MNKNKPDIELIPSRGEGLSCLAWTQKELQQKLKSGRFRDIPLEKARNEKIRLLVYTSGACRSTERLRP